MTVGVAASPCWLDVNDGIAVQLGMRRWKRRQMDRFLAGRSGPPPHARTPDEAIAIARRNAGAIAVWPSRVLPDFRARAAAAGVETIAVEDGFLRSAGLGVHLVAPQSVVLDRRGVHYDGSRPSDLEHLLASTSFSAALLDRAHALRTALVTAGVGKYGAGSTAAPLPPHPRRILVIGQVADDESLRLGDPHHLGNAGLLAAARTAAPEALVIYKPHPDVLAGHRAGRLPAPAADVVLDRPAALAPLLAQVDRVHVLTSLAGFEALLRGVSVTCHGQPFFAGWGLTEDRAPIPRRTRRLSLDELVAGALILYPRYLDPVTQRPCAPEVLLRRMTEGYAAETILTRARRWQGALRRLWGG